MDNETKLQVKILRELREINFHLRTLSSKLVDPKPKEETEEPRK